MIIFREFLKAEQIEFWAALKYFVHLSNEGLLELQVLWMDLSKCEHLYRHSSVALIEQGLV